MGTGDHVHRDGLADPAGGGGSGVGGRLDGPHVAPHVHGDVSRADVLPADEEHVGGLDHGVGGLDGPDETLGLHHAQRFHGHRALLFCGGSGV